MDETGSNNHAMHHNISKLVHRASNVCSSDDIGGHFSSPLVFVRTDLSRHLTPWAKPPGCRMDDGLVVIGKCDL